MMTTKIICLANSKKFNERCVAGIEVNEDYNPLFLNLKPKWLRPVSNNGNGEFPAIIAQNLNLLDIVEFDSVGTCPSGHQTENVYFSEDSVKKVTSINSSDIDLDNLTNDRNILLFGNRGKAVHEEYIDSLDYSLDFVKVNTYEIFIKPENNQLRMNFNYNSVKYDLPITDINFETMYRNNITAFEEPSHIYLTISLAVKHNNYYSKLIAGIIYT